MSICLEPLAIFVADFIEALPTEATFRNTVINVRIGEAPKTREMLLAGFEALQPMECLMKVEDTAETAPAGGETLRMAGAAYKIGTVTPLLSLTQPAGYRLTLSRLV